MSSIRKLKRQNDRNSDNFIVVSYVHKANIEFIVIRESWMVEEVCLTDDDSDSDDKTQYFFWPRDWMNLSTKELEELYAKEIPDPDWKKYAILRCHKTKGKLLDAKNARNRAEDDYRKGKGLSEIDDTTDDDARTRETRKSRNRKSFDDNFVTVSKRAKTSTVDSLSSKIQASKDMAVYAKKTVAQAHESIQTPVLSPAPLPSTSHNINYTSQQSIQSTNIVSPNRILPFPVTPPSRYASQNSRTPRTVDSFLKSLASEKFNEGEPLDGVQFKFYMTGMFLGIKSLQNDVSLIRAGTSGSSVQPPPPPLGNKPMDVEWPLNPDTFVEQEELLKDDYLFEEMIIWLSNSNNSLYSTKYGEMAKNLLQRMFPVELQTSFVFSKDSYSKTEVRFEGTRTYRMIRGALEKAHGSGNEKLGQYRDCIQFWWDHKSDNFKEFLQRKNNAQIFARFGDDDMLLRERINLFKEYYATRNDLDPKMFRYDKGDK